MSRSPTPADDAEPGDRSLRAALRRARADPAPGDGYVDRTAQAAADSPEPLAVAVPVAPKDETMPSPTPRPIAKSRNGWAKPLALLVAFGVGGGCGAGIVVAAMVAASMGLIPWFG